MFFTGERSVGAHHICLSKSIIHLSKHVGENIDISPMTHDMMCLSKYVKTTSLRWQQRLAASDSSFHASAHGLYFASRQGAFSSSPNRCDATSPIAKILLAFEKNEVKGFALQGFTMMTRLSVRSACLSHKRTASERGWYEPIPIAQSIPSRAIATPLSPRAR